MPKNIGTKEYLLNWIKHGWRLVLVLPLILLMLLYVAIINFASKLGICKPIQKWEL